MGLAENGELFRLIEETDSFSEKLARHYFRQLIESTHKRYVGIEYLHDAGYSHRDIKTENILIDVNYKLKIADFGFACSYIDRESQKKIPMDPNCRAVGSPMTNPP
jgi:serine/threonine protein kinase